MKNAPISPVLRLVYGFFRMLAALALPVYFRERIVLGKENFRFDGPALLAVNHPNTLTDILNSGLQVRQEIFFLANYGLFRTPFTNWLFRTLFCIPVKRREDLRPGESRNNHDTFEQSYQHLEKNGVLFIAPEGASWMRRFVGSPLKSGVARIAFGAEVRNNWTLGLKIVPVGLTYDAPNHFRSRTAACAGEPLLVSDWRAKYEQHPDRAIDDLLNTVYSRLTSLGLHARDEQGERMLNRIEQLIHYPKRVPWRAAFLMEREKLAGWLDDQVLAEEIEQYFLELERLKVHDTGVAWAATGRSIWGHALLLLLGIPLALPAAVFWFLPCFLPWLVNRLSGLYIGYSSTVKILGGIIFFPLALGALYGVFARWFPGWWPWVVLLIAPLLGLFLEQYWDWAKATVRHLQVVGLNREMRDQLVAMRKKLVLRVNS